MQYQSTLPSSPYQRELDTLSPDAQAYVAALRQDSKLLQDIFFKDGPGEDIRLLELIGTSMMLKISELGDGENAPSASDQLGHLMEFFSSASNAILYSNRRWNREKLAPASFTDRLNTSSNG